MLLIGDVGNYFQTVSKFVKKSKIHIINFPKDEAGIYTYDENYELFENYKVRDQVKKINEIKKNFDLTNGTFRMIRARKTCNPMPQITIRGLIALRLLDRA